MTLGSLRVIAVYMLVIAKTLRLADRPGELITRAEVEAGADRDVAVSLCISQSTGTLTVFKAGKMITDIQLGNANRFAI